MKDLNEKVLKATGSQNNVQLLETVNTQAQAYATQVKGEREFKVQGKILVKMFFKLIAYIENSNH